jgi:molybdenum cofactor cytidylyltransferase
MTAERTGPVAGIVLAAGSSSRMGRNKLFLKLGGQTILLRAVTRALAAALEPVIVVLGHEAERARAELAALPCATVTNPDYARGMSGSLALGIDRLPAHARAAVVVLADMPFVTAPMLEALVRRYRESSAPLVVSQYGEVTAPPILYERSLFAELRAQEGDGCGKRVIQRHRAEAVSVPWPAAALRDLDAPEDYEWARQALEAGLDA